ncbi:MAG: myxosortase-dependent metalloprotease, MXAN_2677/MXAN_2678 family [Myxococcaceae bacterium]
MIAPALLLAALIAQPTYLRSRVDTGVKNDPKAHCLYWHDGTISYVQSANGSPDTTGDTEFDAVNKSFATWNAQSDACGNFHFTELGRTNRRDVGYDAKSVSNNQNLVLFRTVTCSSKVASTDSCWSDGSCNNSYDCWQYADKTIALTTTTYDRSTGQIFDADMELNAAKFTFTTVDAPECIASAISQACVATDVQNTVTHEAGHVLGLDHPPVPPLENEESTMFASAPLGETKKRSLDSASKQFVCDVYPKGHPSKDCVIEQVSQDLGKSAGCDVTPGLFAALSILVLGRFSRRRFRD